MPNCPKSPKKRSKKKTNPNPNVAASIEHHEQNAQCTLHDSPAIAKPAPTPLPWYVVFRSALSLNEPLQVALLRTILLLVKMLLLLPLRAFTDSGHHLHHQPALSRSFHSSVITTPRLHGNSECCYLRISET